MDLFGIGSVVGGLLGYKGQKSANASNERIAQEQEDFQREMSNTSYQRAVSDMQLAGLNPMLAYQQGGASTPSGATGAPQQNELGAGISTAVQAAGAMADLENKGSMTKLNDAMAMKAGADTLVSMNSAEASRFEIDKMLGLRHKGLEFDTDVKEGAAWKSAFEQDASRYNPSGNKGDEMGRRAADAELKRRIAESFLTQADVPRARAERDFYEGGGKYMPYVNAFGDFISSATGLKRFMGGGSRLGR